MKRKRILSALTALILTASFLTGCSKKPPVDVSINTQKSYEKVNAEQSVKSFRRNR